MMVADRAEMNQKVLDTPAKRKAALSKRNTHLSAAVLQTVTVNSLGDITASRV